MKRACYTRIPGNEDKLRDVEFAPKLGEELRQKFGDKVIQELQNLGYSLPRALKTFFGLDWVETASWSGSN